MTNNTPDALPSLLSSSEDFLRSKKGNGDSCCRLFKLTSCFFPLPYDPWHHLKVTVRKFPPRSMQPVVWLWNWVKPCASLFSCWGVFRCLFRVQCRCLFPHSRKWRGHMCRHVNKVLTVLSNLVVPLCTSCASWYLRPDDLPSKVSWSDRWVKASDKTEIKAKYWCHVTSPPK